MVKPLLDNIASILTFCEFIKQATITYDEKKALLIKAQRNIDFKTIIQKLKKCEILKLEDNINYSNQVKFILKYNFDSEAYTIVAPCKLFEDKKEIVITTAYPDRRYFYLLSK